VSRCRNILYHLETSYLSNDLEGIGHMMKDWKKYGMNIDFSHEGGDSDIMWRAKLMVVTDEVLQQLHESCAMECPSHR